MNHIVIENIFAFLSKNKIIWNSIVNFSVKLKLKIQSFGSEPKMYRSSRIYKLVFEFAASLHFVMHEERLLMRRKREIDDKTLIYKEVILLRVNETIWFYFFLSLSLQLCLFVSPACYWPFLFLLKVNRLLFCFCFFSHCAHGYIYVMCLLVLHSDYCHHSFFFFRLGAGGTIHHIRSCNMPLLSNQIYIW